MILFKIWPTDGFFEGKLTVIFIKKCHKTLWYKWANYFLAVANYIGSSHHRVRTESWIIEKVLKFAQQLSRTGKSLEIVFMSGKMVKKKSWEQQDKCFRRDFIQFYPYVCSAPWLSLFLHFKKVSIDHLFDNLKFTKNKLL